MPYEPQGELESENTTVNVDIENADLVNSLLEAEETQAVTDQVTEMAQQDVSTEQPQTEPQTEKTNPFKVDNPEGNFVGPNASTPAARTAYELISAPAQGPVDTITDAINFGTKTLLHGQELNIPKVKPYESNVAQGLRNISGLVIPSLGLRSMLIKGATKLHLSKQAAPWMQRLGNQRSFAFFSKFGADVGTGAAVDYVAEQNQKDDNLFGALKNYWPKTYQFIPESWATNDGDSPDIKRSKNVNEGIIFGMLSSLVEGVAYITKAGKSLKRTTKLTSENPALQKRLDELTNDEFSKVTFSENPVEDTIMRNSARREQELDNLGEYLKRTKPDTSEPILGVHDVFDPSEAAVRTKDADGILGAAVDAVRIAKNEGTTYGRLGSVVTEASLKYGLEVDNRTQEVLIKSLVEEIKNGGRYTAELASGKKLTFDEIDAAGTRLAEILEDPRMSPGDMKKVLDGFKKTLDDGVNQVVGSKGYNAVNKTIKSIKDELLDLDVKKARAYLATSLAGQVSDVAEGVRLMDDNMVMERAIDQIADRLEYLLVEKGIAAYDAGSTLAFTKTWKKASDTKNTQVMQTAGAAKLAERQQAINDLIPNAKNYATTLRETAKSNPDFLRTLMLVNEFADGDVNSMYQLNKMISEDLGVFKKAIIDGNPDTPSLINRAWFSNLYNSTLSAFSTPIKAAVGNVGGLTARPMATMLSAGLSGDLKEMQKAYYTYFMMDDTLLNASKHLGQVFKKVSNNPQKVSYVVREDIANKMSDKIDYLRSYADAAEKNGEPGAKMLVELYEDLNALADDPVLRLGANSMTALDGFSRSVVSSSEAKSRAFNKLIDEGKEVNRESLLEVSEQIRKQMFDTEGMIDDAGVNYLNSEIALNLDSDTIKGLNDLVNKIPPLKPFLMFPRTSANILDTFGKYSPVGKLSSDYRKMWGDWGRKKLEDFNPEEIKEILEKRGQVFDPKTYMSVFKSIRHEVRGKVALGRIFTGLAIGRALQGMIHGNGHYNKSRQRVRTQLNWKKRAFNVPGTDQWVSGDFLGPLGDWMFTVADLVDNFDLMSDVQFGDRVAKLVFIFGSAVTSRSVLSNIEPLNDILQGNGFAFNRWSASFGNNAIGPFGGFRNEIGRVMNPALRQMKGELLEGWRNRNNWLDLHDPQGALPEKFDPIDGNRVGYPESMWQRIVNTYSPAKFSDSLSPEKQFLVDVEYDMLANITRSINGVELEETEKSAIMSKMGELGEYKRELKKIIKASEKLTVNSIKYPELNGTVGFINILKKARSLGLDKKDIPSEKFLGVFKALDKAFNNAKRNAELQLDKDMRTEIENREYLKQVGDYSVESGNMDGVGLEENDLLNMYR